MIKLALASLRYRAAASLATFLAVLLGGAILIACGGLFETAIRLDALPQRLAGAPLVIAGQPGFPLPDEESETVAYVERPGLPAGLVDRLSTVDGVARAIPDASFPAVGPAESGTTLAGHDWAAAALTPYTLSAGTEPRASGEVVLDAGSARAAGAGPGGTVRITVNGQPADFTVSGVAQAQGRVDAPALFFSADDARRFAPRPDVVDSIGIFPAPGTDLGALSERIGRELPPGAEILTGDQRGAAEFTGVNAGQLALILLAAVFGGMVIVVMILVVSATISLTVRQRQRELALLRAGGATPDQVRRFVVAETAVVAGLAALAAVGLGALLGEWIFTATADAGVVPSAVVYHQGLIPFASGVVIALLAAFVTARLAARAGARTRPIQALAEAAIPPVAIGPTRRLLGLIFAAGTLALAITTLFMDRETAAAAGGPATLTGAIAVGLFGPRIVATAATRWSGPLRRISGRDGDLAVTNLRARAVHFAAVLTPLTLATAIILGNIYSTTTMNDAYLEAHVDQFEAEAVVQSSTGVIAPELAARVRETPGVATASAFVASKGWLEKPYDGRGSDPLPLVGLSPQDQSPAYRVPVAAGSLRDLTGQTVALPQGLAEEAGVRLGDRVTMRLGDGSQAEVTVVALLDVSVDYGALLLPVDLLAPHTTAGLPTQLLIRATPGVDAGDLIGSIANRTNDFPGTVAGGNDLIRKNFAAGLDIAAWINFLLAVLAIAYAAIAAVNTLAVAVLSRRREFAAQRLAGATRRQVRRMLLAEVTFIVLLSLVLGTVVSLFTVFPIAFAAGLALPSGPIWIFLATVLAAFLIAWPVTQITSRLAMRRKPIDTITMPVE